MLRVLALAAAAARPGSPSKDAASIRDTLESDLRSVHGRALGACLHNP